MTQGEFNNKYIDYLDEGHYGMDWEEWDELSGNDKQEIINDIVQEEFELKISWSIENIQDSERN